MLLARAAEMKAIDSHAMERCGVSGVTLMQNAAQALVDALLRRFSHVRGRPCAVVCGSGNNGGDGFAAALLLRREGALPTVILACPPESIRGDAAYFYERVLQSGITVEPAHTGRAHSLLSGAEFIIDALYGTGFHGTLGGEALALVKAVNECRGFVLSADLPSGAVCDTGQIGGGCVRAHETVAFALPKPCHFLHPAAPYCGRLTVADIGIPPAALDACRPALSLITRDGAAALLPCRPPDSHKGTFGRLALFCGSADMPGAAQLAIAGALRTGAGLIHLCAESSVCAAAIARSPEAVCTHLSQRGGIFPSSLGHAGAALGKASAVLIGCGLGLHKGAQALTVHVLQNAKTPVIVDGDGITHLSRNINRLSGNTAGLILTPHPGEMARLAGCDVKTVQRDRIGTALSFAARYGCTVCLKGAGTVVALPDGRAFVNTTGGSGLSKGGSGDVLAGMIASFAAQGLPAGDAACLGVWLHGAAGDRLSERLSCYGALPSDLPLEACALLGELEKEMIL